jgi:O-antigen ligase
VNTPRRAPPKAGTAQRPGRWPRVFGGLFGAFLGLSLLKFGNPPIFEKFTATPPDVYSIVLGYPWPISWAYALLGLVALAGLACVRPTVKQPAWLLGLPLAWLAWECLATTQSVDAQLSVPTLKHLAAGVTCFYLGLFSLGRVADLLPFWLGLVFGFVVVLAVGWDQQFGGLAETRRYFYLYIYPTLKEIPPEYLKRVSSNRIFSTLFYPNALAGAVLLLGPPSLATVWGLRAWFTTAARGFLVLALGLGALACVVWSGSKGGWLLFLVLGLVAMTRLPLARRYKVGVVTVILLAGLSGFIVRYSSFFEKGATSVGARFDYWRAAVQTTLRHPITGTGPGTFAVVYGSIKRPAAEMTRLVHNDYLEQASDSGLPGLALYTTFIVVALGRTFRRTEGDWQRFTVWLGVLGWSLQGLLEFGLYLPALAWPALALLGWLLGSDSLVVEDNPVDKPKVSG